MELLAQTIPNQLGYGVNMHAIHFWGGVTPFYQNGFIPFLPFTKLNYNLFYFIKANKGSQF